MPFYVARIFILHTVHLGTHQLINYWKFLTFKTTVCGIIKVNLVLYWENVLIKNIYFIFNFLICTIFTYSFISGYIGVSTSFYKKSMSGCAQFTNGFSIFIFFHDDLFNSISAKVKNFTNLSDKNKLFWLLNCENQILNSVGRFLYQNMP
jgi:hypothetical protein